MPLNDTPCPRCGKRCDMAPGVNVFPDGLADGHTFLVCWGCNLVRHVQKETWAPLREARRKLRERVSGVAER